MKTLPTSVSSDWDYVPNNVNKIIIYSLSKFMKLSRKRVYELSNKNNDVRIV